MKKTLACSILLISLFLGCKKVDKPGSTEIKKEKISGYIQKGPFLNGTQISMYELDSKLAQTGKVFNVTITDNKGSFEIDNITLSSNFVYLSADGFYYNEIAGAVSSAPLKLTALSDITDISTINVNILTHLEKRRIEYLVKQGKTFKEAKTTAQKEILAIFGFTQANMKPSESLDISASGDDNAILLAISLILQGNLSVGELSELLATISADIEPDGVLNNEILLNSLRESAKALDLTQITNNLDNRFKSLNVTASLPDFVKYVNTYLSYSAKKPDIISVGPAYILDTSAMIYASINPNSASTTVTFEYGETTNYSNSIVGKMSPLVGLVEFSDSAIFSKLTPITAYHFRVKAENEKGIVYSDDNTLITMPSLPVVSTLPDSNITYNGVKASAIVRNKAGGTISSRGFCWSTSTNPTINNSQIQVGNGEGVFQYILTGLSAKTKYYIKAYAVNELGISYGNEIVFTTENIYRPGNGMIDIDGHSYKSVIIGNQEWSAENLNVSRYQNGDLIPLPFDSLSAVGAACYYNNDSVTYSKIYGKLYNWYAVIDPRKLAPKGWHIPSNQEWDTLLNFVRIYNQDSASTTKSLKSTNGWLVNNGNNLTGFNAVPSGKFQYFNVTNEIRFGGFGSDTEFWTTTIYPFYQIVMRTYLFGFDSNTKDRGLSIRCIKD